MEIPIKKKTIKNQPRRVVGGIKLPPIELVDDDDVKTILDIDPQFYSIVQGRPIRSDKSIIKYKKNIKEVALKRTLRGFLVDEIMRIDREMNSEIKVYETAVKHFEECRHSFDKFLAHDNDTTITIMQKSDAVSKDLASKLEEQRRVRYELSSLKSKLQYIDESLLISLSYENFLHKTAPISWQKDQKVNLDTKHTELLTIDSDISGNVNVDLIKTKLSKLTKPRLYFQTPDQLPKIFDFLQQQNLNYLLATEKVTLSTNKFLKARDALKDAISHELSLLQKKINEVEEIILWREARETELKDIFMKILNDKMRYLLSSETVLKLYSFVEFAYEQIIQDTNITKMGALDMTLALEREYDNMMLDLTLYDTDMVKEIEKEIFESSKKQIKQAMEASKLIKEVDKLDKRLRSSYEPSRGQ